MSWKEWIPLEGSRSTQTRKRVGDDMSRHAGARQDLKTRVGHPEKPPCQWAWENNQSAAGMLLLHLSKKKKTRGGKKSLNG